MTEAKVEKRNRPPKSCEPCRVRKLKCNRELPCDSCTRRDKTALCQYAPNADRTEKKSGGSSNASGSIKSVGSRLKRLEDMILKMAANPAVSAATGKEETVNPGTDNNSSINKPMNTPALVDSRPSDNAAPVVEGNLVTYAATESLGSGQLDNGHTNYIDSSHWSSLLEEIKELREQLDPGTEDEQPPTSVTTGGSIDWTPQEDAFAEVVFAKSSQTLGELLHDLPPRPVCDRLISYYFRIGHSVMPVLHPVQFQEEYASFWNAPPEAPPLWVALLFAILGASSGLFRMSRYEQVAGIPTPEAMAEKSRQCLVLGSYVTVDKYSIEAMLVLLQGHYFYVSESGDSSHDGDSASRLWFLMGMIIRLAVRRGYHRDPSKLPSTRLSPFEAEMRRRVWVGISQVDSLMSYQLGLPSMIPADYCDTELPRNLECTDLHPGITVLPPSRPTSDTTSILYSIVKSTIMSGFRAVIGLTRSLAPRPYNETVALDESLRKAYRELPVNYQYKPLSQSLIDNPSIIMNRTTIEMLYLKSIIVLHRKYLTAAHDWHHESQRTMYAPSRHACLTAACTVLDRQVELSQATRDGGLLSDSQWMISALTVNDFILATVVICLDLTLCVQQGQFSGSSSTDALAERCLSSIRATYPLWLEASVNYSEARSAADAIESTIRRVEAAQKQPAVNHGQSGQSTAMADNLTWSEQDGPMSTMDVTDDLADMDFINWAFLDNNCHDPLNEDMDLTSWMQDATKASGFMDPF